MLLSLQADTVAASRQRVPAWWVAVPLLIAAGLFMFVDGRVPPIYLWDESRLAVNALEMSRRGWSLVTTYGFAPDLWNTKPPLAIWLMTGSIELFGESELALRLPSMVAAIGTLAIVFAFVRRVTHRVAPAALAVFLLATSVAFFGRHGARSGDFDMLLCFFTTAYLSLLFFAVHRREPPPRLLVAVALLVAAAALTKTVAALLPGVGVAVYMAVTGRLRRGFASPRYVIAVVAALVPLALFYGLREWAAPGYLHAMWYNDFVGRYHDQLGPITRSRWFFFQELGYDWMFSAGPLALLAPLGLNGRPGQSRQALLFAMCCVGSQLALITLPATRLVQYMLPAVPWLAIACAIAMADRLPRYFARGGSSGRTGLRNPAAALIVVTILLCSMTALRLRYQVTPKEDLDGIPGYGRLFADLHEDGIDRVTVAEPGMDVGGLTNYAPQLDVYILLWRGRGMTVARLTSLQPRSGWVVSCDPAVAAQLLNAGGKMLGSDGCAGRLAFAGSR